MDDRKWEDLPTDCLVNIFAGVGLSSLIYRVPCVCKSWHKATLSPQCWQSLKCDLYHLTNIWQWPAYILTSFVKFVVHRGHGTVSVLDLSSVVSPLSEEALHCIAVGCPSLKRLVLSICDDYCRLLLPNLICKWKDLNALALSSFDDNCRLLLPDMICKWKDLDAFQFKSSCWTLENIIPQINIHCKKFVSLSAIYMDISRTEASGIATLLSNIEFLCLRNSLIEKCDLVVILKGCKKLVQLDVSGCYGFEVDDEIMNLASHIATFKFEGVRLF